MNPVRREMGLFESFSFGDVFCIFSSASVLLIVFEERPLDLPVGLYGVLVLRTTRKHGLQSVA